MSFLVPSGILVELVVLLDDDALRAEGGGRASGGAAASRRALTAAASLSACRRAPFTRLSSTVSLAPFTRICGHRLEHSKEAIGSLETTFSLLSHGHKIYTLGSGFEASQLGEQSQRYR